MTTFIPAIVEIWLCDPAGVRISCLDYATEFEYALVCNDRAPFRLKLPARFDRNLIRLDSIVEIWRGHEPGTLRLDYCGFVRSWTLSDDVGSDFTEIRGYSLLDLLRRRVVAYAAASAQAAMTDQADDMIKAIVKDNLGSDAIAARDLTSVGGGVTLQADLADGQSITKAFSHKNVLEICQEIADASRQAGTEVYFDLVPTVTNTGTGGLAFVLQTFTDQRGADRTADSDAPVYVGTAWGNLQNGSLEYDYSDEINYAYVLGQGEEASRETAEVSDSGRMGMSIWNRCEGAKDARNVQLGQAAQLTGDGNTFLEENRPVFRFGGDVVETPAFRYGRDWFHGDRVTAEYGGKQMDAMIRTVTVGRGSDGQETITARLEVEE
jgi:hypothetical protein